MKKFLVMILVIALCIPCLGTNLFVSAASSNVYMIVTNPGENMNTQMNISFHANPGYTGCYVEYTKATDTSFASATKATGTQDTDDYQWFYNRHTTMSNTSSRYTTKFIHYSVNLTNLTPNTKYIYRVCDGKGGYSDTYAFKTAGQDKFSILWTSDTHLTNTETVKINRFSATTNYVASLADYEIGLHFSTGDVVASGERHTFWQTAYNDPSIKKYTFAMTTGNHDVYDSMMSQDTTYSQYWKGAQYMRVTSNYPKNSYVQTSSRISGYLNGDGYSQYIGNTSDTLFDPGTGTYAGKQITGAKEDLNGRSYWFLYNRVLFIIFDYYAMTAGAEKTTAFNWANSVIEANKGKYDYLISAQHIYLFDGASGTDTSGSVYDAYSDWAATANVDILLCGDNHIYFRTGSLINGVANNDPEKGTYVLQAPAITNTNSYPLYTGPAGVAINRYSNTSYMGGAIMNFDERGLTLEVAVSPDGNASSYTTFETVTIPKKVRYNDISTGVYTTKTSLNVKETFDDGSSTLTTIPAGTLVEVNAANGVWGRVRYNGYTGWINLAGYTASYTTTDVTAPEMFEISNVNVGYASAHLVNAYTPAYGSTIANGGWLFSGNVTITGVKDSTGAYKVTAQNTDGNPKNTTSIPANGCVLLINKNYAKYSDLMAKLAVGKYFTLDSGKVTVYTANPGEANVTPTIPGTEPEEPTELVPSPDSPFENGEEFLKKVPLLTTAKGLKNAFTNKDLRVTNAKGNSVEDNAVIGTGYVISCYVDGKATDSVTVVIINDVDGDGAIGTSDYITVGLSLKNSVVLSGAYKQAADSDADGSVSTSDYIALKAVLKK